MPRWFGALTVFGSIQPCRMVKNCPKKVPQSARLSAGGGPIAIWAMPKWRGRQNLWVFPKGAREGRDPVGQYGCIPPLQEGSKPSPQVVIHVAGSLHSPYIRAILQKNAAFLEIVLCVLPKNAIFNNRAAFLGGTKQIQNLRSGDQN